MALLHCHVAVQTAGNIDQAHGLFIGAAVWACDPGHCHSGLRIGLLCSSGRHFPGRGLTYSPVFFQRVFPHSHHFPLGLIGVGDKALVKDL